MNDTLELLSISITRQSAYIYFNLGINPNSPVANVLKTVAH
jgi:hypothetical protein